MTYIFSIDLNIINISTPDKAEIKLTVSFLKYLFPLNRIVFVLQWTFLSVKIPHILHLFIIWNEAPKRLSVKLPKILHDIIKMRY